MTTWWVMKTRVMRMALRGQGQMLFPPPPVGSMRPIDSGPDTKRDAGFYIRDSINSFLLLQPGLGRDERRKPGIFLRPIVLSLFLGHSKAQPSFS
jgi:hypothetical protein